MRVEKQGWEGRPEWIETPEKLCYPLKIYQIIK